MRSAWSAMLVLSIVLTGCRRELDKVVLSAHTLSLHEPNAGDGFKVELIDTRGRPMEPAPPVTFTSSDTEVATVDERGWVTAHKGGTATITAEAGGKKDTATVDVSFPSRLLVDVGGRQLKTRVRTGEAVAVTDEIVLQGIGAQTTVKGSLVDDADRPVRPTTPTVGVTDPTIVTLEKDGATLTARAFGRSLVSVSTESYSMAFFVRVAPPATITVDAPRSIALRVGQTQVIPVRLGGIPPGSASPSLLTFESSDPPVATVQQDGRVLGEKAGKAQITVRAGSASAVVNVVVSGGPRGH